MDENEVKQRYIDDWQQCYLMRRKDALPRPTDATEHDRNSAIKSEGDSDGRED